jgi:hypothetical protein
MRHRNILQRIERLETAVNTAKEELLELIKQQLNEHAGSRKQYQLTREAFGEYPDSKKAGKKIIDLKDLYSIKAGGIPAFKIEKVILSLKNFYEKKDKKI